MTKFFEALFDTMYGISVIGGVTSLALFPLTSFAFGLGVAIITFGASAFVFYIVKEYFQYVINNKNKIASKVKFKMFRDLYCLNPDFWDYERLYTLRIRSDRYGVWSREYETKNNYIRFGFFSWLRYRLWLINKKNEEERAANLKKKADENENLKILLENVQFDIDRIRAKSDREIAQAKEILDKVVKNNDNL